MGALPKKKMTATQFLRWSATQAEGRYELASGDVVMMSPETVRHVEIKNEAWLALRNAIAEAGLDCRARGDGIGLRISDNIVREPDITVQCKPANPDALTIDAPVIVVEVISPTSIRSDAGAKVAEYFSLPSIQHYLIVDPYNLLVIRHTRISADGKIETSILRDGQTHLDPPGLTVAVSAMLGGD